MQLKTIHFEMDSKAFADSIRSSRLKLRRDTYSITNSHLNAGSRSLPVTGKKTGVSNDRLAAFPAFVE